MLHEEQVPPAMTMVLAMGPKLLVKSAVERNLATKSRQDYTSGEVAQLCADAVHVIKRSGLEYEEASWSSRWRRRCHACTRGEVGLGGGGERAPRP